MSNRYCNTMMDNIYEVFKRYILYISHSKAYLLYTCRMTAPEGERCIPLFIIPTSYVRGPGFDSWPAERLP